MLAKTCTVCQRLLPLDSFHRDLRGYGDGCRSKCMNCRNADNLAYRVLKPDVTKAATKSWRDRNPSHVKQYARIYHAANRAKDAKRFRRWRLANKDRAAEKQAAYEARKLMATPKWANRQKILDFYKSAKELSLSTGREWHVDHIVPLKSALVCGLHWEGNLQILLKEENCAKSNRHWPGCREFDTTANV